MSLNNHCIKGCEIILFRLEYLAEVCLILTIIVNGSWDFFVKFNFKKVSCFDGGSSAANQEQKKGERHV